MRYHRDMSANSLDAIFDLTVPERISLVEAIWDSVANDAASIRLEPWQAQELDRRVAEFEANPTEGISLSELKQKIADG